MQIRFTLRFIQYMVTNVLRSKQYNSGVRKCKVGRNLHHIPRSNQSFFSDKDSSQHRFFALGIQKLVDREDKCLSKLKKLMLKNKTIMVNI